MSGACCQLGRLRSRRALQLWLSIRSRCRGMCLNLKFGLTHMQTSICVERIMFVQLLTGPVSAPDVYSQCDQFWQSGRLMCLLYKQHLPITLSHVDA